MLVRVLVHGSLVNEKMKSVCVFFLLVLYNLTAAPDTPSLNQNYTSHREEDEEEEEEEDRRVVDAELQQSNSNKHQCG